MILENESEFWQAIESLNADKQDAESEGTIGHDGKRQRTSKRARKARRLHVKVDNSLEDGSKEEAERVIDAAKNEREAAIVGAEYLQLSLEEAFFLRHAIGSLRVVDGDTPMSSAECWRRFCNAKPKFVELYAIYHHWRSFGFVPRSGLKYASDLVVYRYGPSFSHAEYAVTTRMLVTTSNGGAGHERESPPMSWQLVHNLNRVNARAAKNLVLCTAIVRDDVDLSLPSCLEHFTVHMIRLRRFK
jgi:tRNA splicing endonuclease